MQKTFSSKPRICVDIRQIHTSGPLRSNVKKCRKTFTRADNLKRNKGELVLDQETVCLSDSKEAPSNDAGK